MLFKTKENSFSVKVYDLPLECKSGKDLAIAKALVRALDNSSKMKSRRKFHVFINGLKKYLK